MTHANRGRSFEAAIEAINEEYRLEGLASIEKIPTEWKVLGWDPRTKKAKTVFPCRKAGVDFQGAIRGGQAIFFDAKETKVATRFPFDNVHDHQLAYLREKSALGAITFLLVHLEPLERCFLVDVEAIERAQAAGKASLSLAELETGIECPWRGWCPDYLAPILSMIDTNTEAS